MKSKEKVLSKIEQVKNSITNLKSSAYGNRLNELTTRFENLDQLVDELESMVSIENGQLNNNRFSGL